MKIILHIDVAGRLVRLYYLPQEKPNNMIDAWSWIDEIKGKMQSMEYMLWRLKCNKIISSLFSDGEQKLCLKNLQIGRSVTHNRGENIICKGEKYLFCAGVIYVRLHVLFAQQS